MPDNPLSSFPIRNQEVNSLTCQDHQGREQVRDERQLHSWLLQPLGSPLCCPSPLVFVSFPPILPPPAAAKNKAGRSDGGDLWGAPDRTGLSDLSLVLCLGAAPWRRHLRIQREHNSSFPFSLSFVVSRQ